MSKVQNDARKFLSTISTQIPKTVSRSMIPNNPMDGIFPKDLSDSVANEIEKLMVENCEPMGKKSEGAIELGEDVQRLKDITGTIRGIVKQGIYILGQKIHEAKEILKKHRNSERTFSEWMKITFTQGHRSAYNALEFFQFHEELEDPVLQNRLKEIPKKAAYLLASRDGELSKKEEILKKYTDQKADDLITIIDEMLPLPQSDLRKRKDDDATSVDTLYAILKSYKSERGVYLLSH